MPVHSIPLSALVNGLPPSHEQARAWCAQLEAGAILYFPETPVAIPEADIRFLLSRQQSESRRHKNIAYKPDRGALSGVDRSDSNAAEMDRLQEVMRRYSMLVARFLGVFLSPYQERWRLDYASFRPFEERGRELPLRHRNNLLHTDAFPTRPTCGWRILRFFHNIHPTRTRDWVVGEPFPRMVGHFVPRPIAPPHLHGPALRSLRLAAGAVGLGAVFPQLKRTPYDEFMMRLHNTMKEDAEFQRTTVREPLQFAPGSSWMVYTETVPHAVLAGQFALEQTLLVDPAAMVTPGSAPVAVLERMAGKKVA